MLVLTLLMLIGFVAGQDYPANDRDNQIPTSKNWPPNDGQSQLTILYRCLFLTNTCHFQNQHNMNKFKHFVNPNRAIYNATSALLLELGDAEAKKHSGGRLIT